MRIDVFTIFPEFLAGPAELSLLGRARREGLVDLRLHDPRDATSDRHRTVDDTPFGGGAGMVMRPEPILDRKSTRLNSSHVSESRMPSSA